MENIIALFDTLIATVSLWVVYKLTGYGGFVGKSLSKVGYGVVIIGCSQIIETAGLNILHTDFTVIELIHRLVLTMGIFLIAWGFKDLMNKN